MRFRAAFIAHYQQQDFENLAVARQIEAQDVEVSARGTSKLHQGVAKDRCIAIEDAQMRHGRKSRRQRFDGSSGGFNPG